MEMNVFYLGWFSASEIQIVGLDVSNQLWLFIFDYKTDQVMKLESSDPITALSKYSITGTRA